jgi:ribosomal protein S12 methylthiotransferase accessory factor
MTRSIPVSFPGGVRVETQLGAHTVVTDQLPVHGGTDAGPSPYDLFLASIATCAGFYAAAFCDSRKLSMEGLGVSLEVDEDEASHLPKELTVHLTLPKDFPEQYRAAILRAVENCKVKKSLAANPRTRVLFAPESQAKVAHASSCL